MFRPIPTAQGTHSHPRSATSDRVLLAASIILQVLLGLFLGHAYDLRIFMATGYLVGTGQNPYIAQNLEALFQNSSFQGITSFGYPPPWALVMGLLFLITYQIIPNFLLYNLAIKLPVIAANICLAYLVAHVLHKSGAQEKTCRRAWIFMLFNPFLLLMSSAWGQFDSFVALLSLLSLFLLSQGKLTGPAVLLALAVSCKPIALPLIPVVFVYLVGRSSKGTLQYFAVFCASLVLFCVAPFALFGWDPAVILQHWNFHFTVSGGLSFMTLLEALNHSTQLTGLWQVMGWGWVPALGIATYALKPGIRELKDLLKKSVALILVFFLCRAWLSEPNIILILPLVLILTCLNELESLSLAAVWVLPLIFGIFNTSIAQLFFPGMPATMDALIKLAAAYDPARFVLRTAVVIAWLAAGWWIVVHCYQKRKAPKEEGIPG
jgi:hypothetical protein